MGNVPPPGNTVAPDLPSVRAGDGAIGREICQDFAHVEKVIASTISWIIL